MNPEEPVKQPVDYTVQNNQPPTPTLSPAAPSAPEVQVDTEHIEENPLNTKLFKAGQTGKFIAIIIATVASVFLMFNYVAGITVVDGISMRPTLKTGDVLIVWKLPKTIAAVTGSQYLPSRSHVVIVTEPNDPKVQLVKRVIALPNEKVDVKNGKTFVYTKDNPSGFSPDDKPYGAKLPKLEIPFQVSVDAGQVFVMGDNRNSGGSIDSRSSVGAIPSKHIVGEVWLRIYPFSRFRTL
jgi:signal peptidase I